MTTTALSVAGSQPALIQMTRTEAWQKVRAAASAEFANARTTQAADRAQFERNYGSTTELDQSFVNDMRAMMLRASAIAINAGAKRNTYDASVVPNKTLEKVAAILAGAVGECELYLATRKARSMFAPPDEKAFIPPYGGDVNDPHSWVGDGARHVVDRVLEGVWIVDDVKINSIHELQNGAKALCEHEMVPGHPDDDVEIENLNPTCEDTGGTWVRCKLGCGRYGREFTLHGEKVFVPDNDPKCFVDVESLCKAGVMYLPDGMTLDEYEKLPKKERTEIDSKIRETLAAEEGD